MMRTRLILGLAVAGFVFPTIGLAADSSDTYRQLNLFGEVFERVRADYVDEVTDETLVEAAINGMLHDLDPHSSFLNAKSYREMQVQTRGEFGGLGIEVTMESGLVKVVTPIDETPAHRAGLQPNDLITHLDGDPVLGLTLQEAVEKMRGPVNTDIKLTIRREKVAEPFDVSLTRAVIKVRAVSSLLKGDVGYIRVSQFNEQTQQGLQDAFKRLEREKPDGLKGYVLDLRNNPGGLLEQAVSVADSFLDQGEIVSTRGRRTDSAQRFNARKGDLAAGLPVVVLINGGSASASEIVAGALQDHKRAILLGTRSFGKGSVQTIIPLAGHGAMRLTTARYYTPSGRSIQAKGIDPDIIVETAARAEPASTTPAQPRRREENLRNRLSPTPNAPREPEPQTSQPATPPSAKDEASEPSAEAKRDALEDNQLARALDLLRGVALFNNRVIAN
ncbi:MAG: PDZ domain-containing protein [Alphaproteobacteria bacterium]|nr:PDZ domain-containing protein [Alphaproteobacteria bacterium]